MVKTHSIQPKDKTGLKIFLSILAFFVSFIVIALTLRPEQNEFVKLRIANLLTKFYIIIIAFIFTKYIDKRDSDFLGIKFEKYRSLKLLLSGCLIVSLQLFFIDTCSYYLGFVEDGIISFSAKSIFIGIIVYLVHTFFTGLSEEMLFRGYILGNLLEKYSEFKAIIISSIVFTAIHVSSVLKLVDYIDIFLMGLILAYFYVITKSLYLSVGLHFFSDFIQEEIFMVQNTSSNPYSLMSFNTSNNLILGNVNLGPKIEFLFVITEIIILFFIYLYKKHQKETLTLLSTTTTLTKGDKIN